MAKLLHTAETPAIVLRWQDHAHVGGTETYGCFCPTCLDRERTDTLLGCHRPQYGNF